MAKTKLYIIRHGKTMFNTIGRAQGWSDTPLTEEGERGIRELGIGLRESGLEFTKAFSSDSGRTIQTMGIILEELDLVGKIPYKFDKRIREWCFGSFDGAYGGDLFRGVIPRVRDTDNYKELTFPELADGLVEVDTAGWAEPWEKLSGRIMDGFTDIAKESEAKGAKNIVIVSHGMTIGTFVKLAHPELPRPHGLDNGSVTHLSFEDGKFTIGKVGDMSYREIGSEKLAK